MALRSFKNGVASIGGILSTTPVASRSLRDNSRVPSLRINSNRLLIRVTSVTTVSRISTPYGASCSRPMRSSSAGAVPSRERKPWSAGDAALRGSPASQTTYLLNLASEPPFSTDLFQGNKENNSSYNQEHPQSH